MRGLAWVQVGAVVAVAVLVREYLVLRRLLQDARLTGICENCPQAAKESEVLHGKLERVHQQQHKVGEQRGAAELMAREGSSVWCHGTDYSNRQCRFRNLCYLPDASIYVFFHHPRRSVIRGLPDDRFSPALADLSTVRDHNRQRFQYVDVGVEHVGKVLGRGGVGNGGGAGAGKVLGGGGGRTGAGTGVGVLMVNHTSVLLKRFHPDNLMHVLHDDLLPLFHRLLGMGLGGGGRDGCGGGDREGVDRDAGDREGGERDRGNREGGDRAGGERDRGNRDGGDRERGDRDRGNREGGDRAGGERDRGNREGGNRDGGDREGGDRKGVEREGVNRKGGDRYGVHRKGGDRKGVDRDVGDREGVDRDSAKGDGGDRDRGDRHNAADRNGADRSREKSQGSDSTDKHNTDSFSSNSFDAQLVFMEGWEPGAYIDLYQLLTSYKPLFLKDIEVANRPICFRDIHVGLTRHTTWYQYGFREPQGPITDSPVTSIDIRQFTDFIKVKFDIPAEETSTGKCDVNTVVIFTRRYNRLILNEVELSTVIAQKLHMKVITLSMETHSIEHIIRVLTETTVLISMHGSLLSLAMFLNPSSILIELFPYGVNPKHYTPYKTLAELPGMGILYRAWRNTRLENTVTHPNRPWDTGGIAHLSTDEQIRIANSAEVPKHLCCRDPEWLFRIYQDTVVDVDEVILLIKTQLLEREIKKDTLLEEQHALTCDRIAPSWVRNLTCVSRSDTVAKLDIKWEGPWNLDFLDAESVEYEIWIQQSGETDYLAYIMMETEHVFDSELAKGVEYYVWVRCLLDSNIAGPFNTEQVLCRT